MALEYGMERRERKNSPPYTPTSEEKILQKLATATIVGANLMQYGKPVAGPAGDSLIIEFADGSALKICACAFQLRLLTRQPAGSLRLGEVVPWEEV